MKSSELQVIFIEIKRVVVQKTCEKVLPETQFPNKTVNFSQKEMVSPIIHRRSLYQILIFLLANKIKISNTIPNTSLRSVLWLVV